MARAAERLDETRRPAAARGDTPPHTTATTLNPGVDVLPSTHRDIANELAAVYANRTPIAPLTSTHPEIDLEDAYRIQELQLEAWLAEGRTLRGRKVGLTSAAMQRQLGVTQPDYGVLLDDFFKPANADIDASSFVQPRVEPEVAFVLRHDLRGPGVNVADAISAIEWVLPALEIIDSRIENWKISFFDTVADNASSGGVVLGSTPKRVDALDLRLQGTNVHVGGRIVETGAGAAVLGSPVNALVWLANTLGERGVPLEAGQVILPGSVTKAITVGAGDTVTAEFAGLGSVTARFA